ncbi:MAG: aminotransferase class I/II-fold pyridoxal phosphate-dependent enzyme, partial [Chloroflexi bacterium]|nr:aminotransferase class I/II-fold pyridoxal phosphate-dependent enzyme [Chloroflexota bacterium]
MSPKFSTQAVHAGEAKAKPFRSITMPIIQSSTFTFADTAEIMDFMRRKDSGEDTLRDEYGRYSNPTQSAAESKLAALEGGEQALLFSSGMSAITTTLSTYLSQGTHLILISGCYHRTREFSNAFLLRWGIEVSVVPIDDFEKLSAAIRPNTRVIFAETPTNPYLRVMDLTRLAEIAREKKITTVVDSTFATPVNMRPLEFGIDLVIHSASKYLGGHNDLLAGVVIGSKDKLRDIRLARGVIGGISNPNDAYLLLRGLKTLDLRIRRQNENGLQVARFLEDQLAVRRVYYPGLSSHPDYAVAAKHLSGFGGVVSFEIDGDFEKTGRFIDRLRLPYIGPTLGGVESIVEQPAALFSTDPDIRLTSGLKDNLVRYALG